MSSVKEECNICCNLSSNTLKCGSCDTLYCIKCSKTYLLTVPDAQCMGCKKQWDERFIRDHFPKTWVNGEYKEYVKKMLLLREKSYIPGTMEIVAEKVRMFERIAKEHEVRNIASSFNLEIDSLRLSLSKLKIRDISKHKEEIDELKKKIDEKTGEKSAVLREQRASLRNMYVCDGSSIPAEEKEEVKEMLKKCPVDDCKGYLRGDVCQVCSTNICGKCNKEKKSDHECNKDDVETYKMILKETKPCPKCSTRIFKIDGCDHMWCVSCHTFFSWKNLTINEGRVHNPEYFRWMRENGRPIERSDGEVLVMIQRNNLGEVPVVNQCVNVGEINTLLHTVFKDTFLKGKKNVEILPVSLEGKIVNVFRFVENLNRYIYNQRNGLRGHRALIHNGEDKTFELKNYDHNTNEEARVDYILNNMSEDDFIKLIIRRYRETSYNNMMYNLSDTMTYVVENTLRTVHQRLLELSSNTFHGEIPKTFETHLFDELIGYMEYYNKESCDIAKMFGYKNYYKAGINSLNALSIDSASVKVN